MRERRYFVYGLGFLLAILPFFPQLSHPAATFFYASLIPLLFLLVCLDYHVTLRKLSVFPLFPPLCAILLVSLVYTVHSVYPYESQQKFLRLLIATLLYLLVAFAAGERKVRVALGWAILCGGAILAVDALWQQLTGYRAVLQALRQQELYDPAMRRELIKTLEAGRALGRFGNPNHLAGYLLLALWAGVLLWRDCKQRWRRGVLGGLALIQLFCLYRTYSRSGLLALLLSAGILGAWMLGRASPSLRRRIVRIGSLVFLCALVGVVVFGGKALGGRLLVTSTIVARVNFFRQALSLIADHFPDGTGLESFRYLASCYIRPGELESLYPHNFFLGAAVESGFIGLWVVVWFALVGLRGAPPVSPPQAGGKELLPQAGRRSFLPRTALKAFSLWTEERKRSLRLADSRFVVRWGTFVAFLFFSSIDFHNEISEILFLFLTLQGLCDARSLPEKKGKSAKRVILPFGILVGICVWWILVFCPYMAATYQQQGLDAAAAGNPAVPFFEKAVAWSPRDAEITNDLGKALRDSRSADLRPLGLMYLRRAAQLNPAQAYLHGDLAEALFEKNRPAEALAENEIACKLFPKKVLYMRRKAKYLQALGRQKEAQEWMKIADQVEKQDKELRP